MTDPNYIRNYVPTDTPPATTVPPAPPPIDTQLETATAPEAAKIVANLTPSQTEQLQTRFEKLNQGEQQDFANKLAEKLPGKQLAAVRTVLEDKGGGKVLDAAVERTGSAEVKQDYAQAKVGLTDATVKALGLSAQDIKGATKPVADKLNAIAQSLQAGEYDAAATQINALKQDAAPLARAVLTGLVNTSSAPKAVKEFVTSNPELIEKAVAAVPGVVADLARGDFGKVVSDLAGNAPLRDQVLGALEPKVAATLKTLGGIGLDKLKDAGPQVIDAIMKGASGDWKGAAVDLAKAAAEGNSVAKTALGKAMQAVEGLPEPIKNILKDPKLQQALAGAGADFVQAILDGKPKDALAAVKDPALRDALADVVLDQQPLKGVLKNLDIDPASVKKAGDAIPDVIKAIEQLDSDPVAALKSLANAATNAPELVADLAAKAGEKLKGDGPTNALLKSLVTDKQLMTTLLGNPELHGAVGDLLNGKVTEALKAIGNNAEANKAVAAHIANAKDPATEALRGKLEKLGYKSETEIASIGPVLGDVVELGEILAKGKDADFAAALQKLGEIGRGLTGDQRKAAMDKLIKPFTSHLPNLSPELQNLVKQAAIGMTDPAVSKTFIDGIKALPGDPGTFLKNTISTLKSLSENPEVAKAMLDVLGNIGGGEPQKNGNIGAFFADSDFNQKLVDTKSLDSFLDGVEAIMVKGDLVEGMKKLGGTIDKLLTDGDEIKIGGQKIGWGYASFHLPSIGLHVGEEGLGNMKTLMDRIYNALPQSARTKIDSAISDAADKVVGGTFPGLGDMKHIISDGKDLITEWGDNDMVDNVLNIAKLLSDVGGLVPGAVGKASDVLGGIVGVIEGIKDASDTVRSSLNLADSLGVT